MPWHGDDACQAGFDDQMPTSVRIFSSSYIAAKSLRAAGLRLGVQRRHTATVKRVRNFRVINTLQPLEDAWAQAIGQTLDLSAGAVPGLASMLDRGEQHALLLSTLAGLSTTIGGGIAIVKKPGNDLLSFLLGVAIGVMATLSVLEMWLHNAIEHGPVAITAAAAAGVALYYAAQPYFPDFDQHQARLTVNNSMHQLHAFWHRLCLNEGKTCRPHLMVTASQSLT